MIVLVVGMHRSGTSALAGLLHSNGIIMGENENFYPEPSTENKKGFFENSEFRFINDMILGLRSYKVKDFGLKIPRKEKVPDYKIRKKMKWILDLYNNKYKDWGWKDPRMCLTIGKWLQVMYNMGIRKNNVRILNTRRAEHEIAFSMMARGNDGDEKHFVKLARIYQMRFESEVGEYGYYRVNFDDLLYKTEETVENISEYIEMKLPDISFIDPEMANRPWT